MNPKLPREEKAVAQGIAMKRREWEQARAIAKSLGKTLSAYIRDLVRQDQQSGRGSVLNEANSSSYGKKKPKKQ